MRRILFFLFAMVAFISHAGVNAIILNPKGSGDDRTGFQFTLICLWRIIIMMLRPKTLSLMAAG